MVQPGLKGSLLAQGEYRYYRNGEPTGIVESWAVYRNERGERLVEVSRQTPELGDYLQVTSHHDRHGLQRCQLNWQQGYGDEIHRLEAHYYRTAVGWRVQRSFDGEARQDQAIDEPALLSPLMRLYTGYVIHQLHRQGGAGVVLVPAIQQGLERHQLLAPQCSERSVERIAVAQTLDEPPAARPCDCFEYLGDQYQKGTRFWVDADGLLWRYRWAQGAATAWDVRLENTALLESGPLIAL